MGTCLRLERVMRDDTVHSSSVRLQIAVQPGRHTAAPIRRSTSDSHPKTPGTLHRQGVCHYLRPGCGRGPIRPSRKGAASRTGSREPGTGSRLGKEARVGAPQEGLLLSNPDAAPGEPIMHRSLGRNYANTGAMVVEAVNGQFLCNQYDRDSQGDNLL